MAPRRVYHHVHDLHVLLLMPQPIIHVCHPLASCQAKFGNIE